MEWNQSALYGLQKCGEWFRRAIMDRERMPPTLRMARGTAVHHIAKEAHKRQMVLAGIWTGETPEFANEPGSIQAAIEAQDLAASAFTREVGAGVTLTKEEEDNAESTMGHHLDVVVRSAERYVSGVAPGIVPVGVERKVTVKPQDSDLVIHGRMDVVEDLGISDEPGVSREGIRDLKTSEKKPGPRVADDSQQLDMYALLHTAATGMMPRRLILDYIVARKTGTDHFPLVTTRSEADLRSIVTRLNVATEAVRAGVFLPTNPSNWWCSPKFCEFFRTCPYVGSRGDRE